MQFQSIHNIFDTLTFTCHDTAEVLTGYISEVIASECGPNEYNMFYTVDLPNGDQYSVEEITMRGTKK